MFYVLDFSTHRFSSVDYAEEAIAKANDIISSGADKYDVEIVAAFGDDQRFTLDEFEEQWS